MAVLLAARPFTLVNALICFFLIIALCTPGSARDKCPADTLQEQRQLAEGLLQAGTNVQQAIVCFREALSKAEKLGNMQAKGEIQGLLADSLEAIGDSSASEKILRKMMRDFPYSPVPLFKLANQFRLKEKWESSVHLYREALSLAPSFTNARVNLAMSYRGMRKFDDSIAAYREAIRGAPDRADIYVNFGVVLDAAGKARISPVYHL
jgi:tetratricopeptide (TPR) repeat protein